MIRKANIADRAVLLLLLDPFQNTDLLQLFPHGHIGQMMHEIIIHVIRAQPAQLLVEIAIQCRTIPDQILGQLGGKPDLFADVVAFED